MSAPVRESKTSLPPWTRRSFRSDVTLRNLLRNTAPPPHRRGQGASPRPSTFYKNSSCTDSLHENNRTRWGRPQEQIPSPTLHLRSECPHSRRVSSGRCQCQFSGESAT